MTKMWEKLPFEWIFDDEYNIHIYVNRTAMEEEGQWPLVLFGFILESIMMVFTMLWTPFSLYIVFVTNVFHNNLTNLYAISMAQSYGFMIARFFLFAYQNNVIGNYQIGDADIPLGLLIASSLRTYVILVGLTAMSSLMLERNFALRKADTYPTKPYRWVFILIQTFSTGWSLLNTFNYTYALLGNLACTIIAVVHTYLSCLSAMLFIRLNDRRRQQLWHNWRKHGYSLAKRYQVHENIKAYRVLVTLVVSSLASHTAIALVFASYQLLDLTWASRNRLAVLLDFLFAFYVFLMSFIGYFSHEAWYNMAKSVTLQLLKKFGCHGRWRIHTTEATPNSSKREPESTVILNTDGKHMYLGATQEDYFKQLDALWAGPPGK